MVHGSRMALALQNRKLEFDMRRRYELPRTSFEDALGASAVPVVEPVDYGAAGLYVVGIQAVVATVAAAVASIAACWLLPASAVSAVRTLALTASVGLLIVKEPLRLGRVRGVLAMFNAMRPCVLVYVLGLTIEQLVHTCIAGEARQPMLWKRLGFHMSTAVMLASGFVRARAPRSETDLPFLMTLGAVLVLAVVPPPAVSMSGPLCEPPTLMMAGERLMRAVLFSSLYAVHAYVAAPRQNEMHELAITVMRASAASLWTLAVHPAVLPMMPAQAGLALYARFQRCDGGDQGLGPPYSSVETRSDGGGSLDELEGGGNVVVSPIELGHEARARVCESPFSEQLNAHTNGVSEEAEQLSVIHASPPLFSDRKPIGLTFNLGPPVLEAPLCSTVTPAKMAEIAATIS